MVSIVRRLGAARIGCLAAAAAVIAGCAAPAPGPTRVVTMSAQDGAARQGIPPAGAVWRLDEQELRALGPLLPTPDPPPVARPREYTGAPLLVPSFIYFGSRHGYGWHDPFYWPRAHRYHPHPRHYPFR